MGVGKPNIEYRSKWERNSLLMIPRFLSEEDSDAIERFVAYLNKLIGKPKAQYNSEIILKLFPSVRLARGVEHVLLRDYYSFSTLPLTQVLPEEESERFLAKGIVDPYKLRLLMTKKVNKELNGFVLEEERINFLNEMAKELGVRLDSLEKVLWLDTEEEKILTRVRDVPHSSKKLLPILNFHIFESILQCSTLAMLSVEGQFNGSVAKTLFWLCKKSGILCEVTKEGNTLRIEIAGPEEVVGKKEKYGRLIAPVFFNLAAFLQKTTKKFQFEIELFLFGRERVFRGSEKLFENILVPEERKRYFQEKITKYDSNVEKRFEAEFNLARGDRKGWMLLVEPELVIQGSTILIPDFALDRNGQRIFLEIVGFWTESYKAKKLQKLVKLKKEGMKNLILLVKDEHRKEFSEKTTGFPVIYYSKRFPIHAILDTLEKRFSDFRIRKAQVLRQLDIIITEIITRLKDSQNITLNETMKLFNCYHYGELEDLMETEHILRRFAKNGLLFIEGAGILHERTLKSLGTIINQMIVKTGSSLSQVEETIRTHDIKVEDLGSLLRKMGFKVIWKALDNPKVVLTEQSDD